MTGVKLKLLTVIDMLCWKSVLKEGGACHSIYQHVRSINKHV